MIYVNLPTRLGGSVSIYSNNLVGQVVELLSKLNCYITLRELTDILGAPVSDVSSAIERIRLQGATALASSPGRAGVGGYKVVGDKHSSEYIRCKCWIYNWRRSNDIKPPDSPIL